MERGRRCRREIRAEEEKEKEEEEVKDGEREGNVGHWASSLSTTTRRYPGVIEEGHTGCRDSPISLLHRRWSIVPLYFV